MSTSQQHDSQGGPERRRSGRADEAGQPSPVTPAFISGWKRMQDMLITSLWDTFSSRQHSHDFDYARASYFRNRVLVIGLIFLLLTPFWTLFDFVILPESSRPLVLAARLLMALGLVVAVLLAYWARLRIALMPIATVLLFLSPVLFYAVVVGSAGTSVQTGLIGYDFIPYMLTVMMAIFPLTLLEGLVLGVCFLLVESYALSVAGVLFSAAGAQALWLLLAILVITLAASYFHLGLLLRLYREATHDGLTGLLNRTAFIASLKQRIAASNYKEIVFMMLDLDHFKRLNDTFGHAVGDRALQAFAHIMRKSVRSSDFVARYGGEEFVVVLMGASQDDAMTVAETIRRKTEAAVLLDHDNREVKFTVSIGVTALQPDENPGQAMRRADEGLYEAKKISRNRVVRV